MSGHESLLAQLQQVIPRRPFYPTVLDVTGALSAFGTQDLIGELLKGPRENFGPTKN